MNNIIHQIWVGPNVMQVRERRCCRLVKSMNPTWEYMFWTDDNLPEMPKEMQEVFDYFGQTKHYAFQADVLRMFLLKEYGGLYIDVDFEPVNSFDALRELDNLFLTWGPEQKRIMNGVIGADKGHPVIEDLCSMVNIKTKFYGPDWFGSKLASHDINTMIFTDFLKQYAFHHHLNSWGG
jgi:mannosyltransferase OCH1-like enzyme